MIKQRKSERAQFSDYISKIDGADKSEQRFRSAMYWSSIRLSSLDRVDSDEPISWLIDQQLFEIPAPKFPEFSREKSLDSNDFSREIVESNDLWYAHRDLMKLHRKLETERPERLNIPDEIAEDKAYVIAKLGIEYDVEPSEFKIGSQAEKNFDKAFNRIIVEHPGIYGTGPGETELPEWFDYFGQAGIRQRIINSTVPQEVEYLYSIYNEKVDSEMKDSLMKVDLFYTLKTLEKAEPELRDDVLEGLDIDTEIKRSDSSVGPEILVLTKPSTLDSLPHFPRIEVLHAIKKLNPDYQFTDKTIIRYTLLIAPGDDWHRHSPEIYDESSLIFLIACLLKESGADAATEFEIPEYQNYYNRLKVGKSNGMYNRKLILIYSLYDQYTGATGDDSYLNYYLSDIKQSAEDGDRVIRRVYVSLRTDVDEYDWYTGYQVSIGDAGVWWSKIFYNPSEKNKMVGIPYTQALLDKTYNFKIIESSASYNYTAPDIPSQHVKQLLKIIKDPSVKSEDIRALQTLIKVQ